ncbi:MAG: preprotein translocase subunit YajC [Verrucomicrobiota bacterium]
MTSLLSTASSTILQAQAQNPGGAGSFLGGPIFMILIMFAMMYFLIIRPQQRQRKELEARVASLEKGDKVVTTGGLHGTVHQISEKTVTLKPGGENVFLTFDKSSVQTVNKIKNTKDEPKDEKK